ncbi:hypothetical protein N9Z52_00055 [Akkermansiaceae bacterium]|nr:hypothetical protein [Akkermansiaceae bacterium]
MKNFKSLLLFTLGVCGSVISYIIILFFVRRNKNIKVFDIDNTLALSDPYIYQFDYNIYDVPVNIRLKCILVSEEKKKARIVYLSHRPIHQIFGTFFWIKKNVSKKVKLMAAAKENGPC